MERARTRLGERQRAFGTRPFLYIGIGGIFLLSFGVFAYLASVIALFPGEAAVSIWVQSWRNSWLDVIMRAISAPGYGMPGLIILGLTLALLVFKGMGKESVLLLALAIVSSSLNFVIKELVARPRPSGELVQVFQNHDSFSFPSGHIMSHVALLGMLGVIAALRMRPCLAKWFIQGGLLVGLFAVGVSRIYLGAHWIGDVVAAYALGAALIAATLGLWQLWIKMKARPSRQGTEAVNLKL